ncbi:2526_t:CDS:1 [Paraglomus occultum]|uniref:2526_t:CDS:1 n=1 Tax=Paraglomus occultum TaxID=144539 RepID=A0A9N9B8B4_9GLOM|nr:2526_t:CDS:1 [Paraglomus occultum]
MRRPKQLYIREDTSIKKGKLSYNDVLNKYAVTFREHEWWRTRALSVLNFGTECLDKHYDDLWEWSYFVGAHLKETHVNVLLRDNCRLQLEIEKKNKIIQDLERRQKRYMQAIEMYNHYIAECKNI